MDLMSNGFVELDEQEQLEINGGSKAGWIVAGVFVICLLSFSLGMYNGYKGASK